MCSADEKRSESEERSEVTLSRCEQVIGVGLLVYWPPDALVSTLTEMPWLASQKTTCMQPAALHCIASYRRRGEEPNTRLNMYKSPIPPTTLTPAAA